MFKHRKVLLLEKGNSYINHIITFMNLCLTLLSGILRDKTMVDKLMCIQFPNDDTQNYPFCRLKLHLDIQFNEPTD